MADITPEWFRLLPYGYAPGSYMNRCISCGNVVSELDKRATRCKPCAVSAADTAALRKQLNAAKIIIAGQDERSIHWAREHGELMQRASDVAGERAANAILTDENAALRAELAKHQESEFHPDWSMLSATRDSLAEHQDMIRRLSERVKVLEDALRRVQDDKSFNCLKVEKTQQFVLAALGDKT